MVDPTLLRGAAAATSPILVIVNIVVKCPRLRLLALHREVTPSMPKDGGHRLPLYQITFPLNTHHPSRIRSTRHSILLRQITPTS